MQFKALGVVACTLRHPAITREVHDIVTQEYSRTQGLLQRAGSDVTVPEQWVKCILGQLVDIAAIAEDERFYSVSLSSTLESGLYVSLVTVPLFSFFLFSSCCR